MAMLIVIAREQSAGATSLYMYIHTIRIHFYRKLSFIKGVVNRWHNITTYLSNGQF